MAPCHRLTPAALPAISAMVRGAARDVSARLGFPVESSDAGGERQRRPSPGSPEERRGTVTGPEAAGGRVREITLQAKRR